MKKLIINANVFDGVRRELKEGVNILIENNLIKKISKDNYADDFEGTIINAKGKTIIPGLIDCHYHIMLSDTFKTMDEMEIDEVAVKSTIIAKELLDRGFTTIRDVGGYVWGLKKSIDEGWVSGPRIYPSGATISQTSGHSDYRQNRAQRNPKDYQDSPFLRQGHMVVADGVPECLQAARDQFFKGATQIKVMGGGGASSLWDPLDTIQYTKNELEAIVEEGSYADLLVVEGNPVEDLDILGSKDNILLVMKDGEIFKDIR